MVSVDLNWMRGDSEFLKHNLSTHTKVPMLEILFAGGGEGVFVFHTIFGCVGLCCTWASHCGSFFAEGRAQGAVFLELSCPWSWGSSWPSVLYIDR